MPDVVGPLAYYGIVVALSAGIVLLEMAKTFGLDIFRAFGNRWAWALLGINVIVALMVYFIAQLLTGHRSFWLASGTGIGYAVILKSRFTLYRQVGSKEDTRLTTLSLKLDEAYAALQDHSYRRLDPELGARRAEAATLLANKHSEAELRQAAQRLVASERIAANRDRDERYLAAVANDSDEASRKYSLAMLLVEMGKTDITRLLSPKGHTIRP